MIQKYLNYNSMFRCIGTTSSGARCRCRVAVENSYCSWHAPIDSEPCSICMETITQRNVKQLDCGHMFHKKCISTWKNEGHRSCPLCREPFDMPEFKVTVTIEPLINNSNIYQNVTFDSSNSFTSIVSNVGLNVDELSQFTTYLSLEADDLQTLHSVLNRIGMELDYANLDALIRRDTE